eukprot:7384500-Prymnesium_polylepis.1
MMKLVWVGTEEPSVNNRPILPLWVQCPEQIAYNRGDESWTPARPVEKNTEGAFQYPHKEGAFYLEQADPTDMFWVNVRWKTPGVTKGKPATLDARKAGGRTTCRRENTTRWQRGHAPRQTQGESVEAGELQVKEAERWSVIFERRKAAWVQRERASRTATAAQSLTRKLQGRGKARWRAGWEFFQKTLGQQSETPAGAKAPPCWRVASKALHSGTEMGELLIQLSTGGRRASEMRRREASGIMPHKVIEASCGSAACKKEPCISAMRQSKFPDYEIRKERQDDPDLTQMAEAAQRSASAMQTPSASGAGGKWSSGGGSEGAPHKKTGEGGSPFRVHQQSGGDFDEGYDNDSDRAVWRPTRPT